MSDLNNKADDTHEPESDAIAQEAAETPDAAPDRPDGGTEHALPAESAPTPRINPEAAPQAARPPQAVESLSFAAPTPDLQHRGDPNQSLSPAPRIMPDSEVERQISRLSRRSFLSGAVGVAAGFLGWRWLIGQYPDNGLPWPFRRALEVNEGFARGYFQDSRLSPTFPRAQATEPRANGEEGLPDDFDPDTWKLHVTGLEGDDAVLTLAAIKALPRVEMVTELKCIEGWSTIVHWAGARFADFIAKYPPAKDDDHHLPQYVALETPDGGYYVGLDMASAMHPQTLLCYEMNGAPLTAEHGAPLRLAIPVKYGIKNIKRIGLIHYTNERPKDYWAERGYDWYAGH